MGNACCSKISPSSTGYETSTVSKTVYCIDVYILPEYMSLMGNFTRKSVKGKTYLLLNCIPFLGFSSFIHFFSRTYMGLIVENFAQ